jgi:hypothetical protein
VRRTANVKLFMDKCRSQPGSWFLFAVLNYPSSQKPLESEEWERRYIWEPDLICYATWMRYVGVDPVRD